MTTFITEKTFKDILTVLFFLLLGSFMGLGFGVLHNIIDDDKIEISSSIKSEQPIENTYYQVEFTFSDNTIDTIILQNSNSVNCGNNKLRILKHNTIRE